MLDLIERRWEILKWGKKKIKSFFLYVQGRFFQEGRRLSVEVCHITSKIPQWQVTYILSKILDIDLIRLSFCLSIILFVFRHKLEPSVAVSRFAGGMLLVTRWGFCLIPLTFFPFLLLFVFFFLFFVCLLPLLHLLFCCTRSLLSLTDVFSSSEKHWLILFNSENDNSCSRCREAGLLSEAN